jgi:aspartate/methionine/tyrosine aminotransferase
MTVGAGGALSLSFFALVNPGDEVLVNAPAFVAYNNYLSVHGGVLKVVPGREDFDLNLEEMEKHDRAQNPPRSLSIHPIIQAALFIQKPA